jgi:hypothetical protein
MVAGSFLTRISPEHPRPVQPPDLQFGGSESLKHKKQGAELVIIGESNRTHYIITPITSTALLQNDEDSLQSLVNTLS